MVSILESRARSVDITTQNYYDLLYAFYLSRNNFGKGSNSSYFWLSVMGVKFSLNWIWGDDFDIFIILSKQSIKNSHVLTLSRKEKTDLSDINHIHYLSKWNIIRHLDTCVSYWNFLCSWIRDVRAWDAAGEGGALQTGAPETGPLLPGCHECPPTGQPYVCLDCEAHSGQWNAGQDTCINNNMGDGESILVTSEFESTVLNY